MQNFRADLHIHSRFSRATSSRLATPLLAAWARVKGLAVIGSGDFTHPKWREELAATLRFDEESGLYLLRDLKSAAAALPELPLPDLDRMADTTGQATLPVHFMLQGEISSIYKRGGKVRKVHNLVFMPNLETAERFSRKLEAVGNLHSDGRPILGLDSRNLLEMVLEADPRAFLIPAHIWTPWFSIFGSKSGFDSMEECFGDLTKEIFALETGLSSDPAMNRLWSALDNFRLISNSDAHSGENLGREANIFSGKVSYDGMLRALKEPKKAGDTRFLGTLEFYPEEGKYHMDGHRKCNVLLSPEETRKLKGICPVCGGGLTIGVLYRVMELADRTEPVYSAQSSISDSSAVAAGSGILSDALGSTGDTNDTSGKGGAGDLHNPGGNGGVAPVGSLSEKGFASLVPLPELLSEILGVGPKARKVTDMYAKTLARFGSELGILQDTAVEDLARFFPPLGEAVARMRRGDVELQGGYDGEYGIVRVFSEKERQDIQRGAGISVRGGKAPVQGLSLLGDETPTPESGKRKKKKAASVPESEEDFIFSDLDGDDKEAGIDAVGAVTGQDKGIATPEGTGAAPAPSGNVSDAAPGTASSEAIPTAQATADATNFPLDPSQERAALAGPGPVLVLAGPGTGKTRTLVARVMHLLEEGISPRSILAVTFTRRAATEMDARLSQALSETLGEGAVLPRTDTLHAIALELWHRTHDTVPVLLSEESARQVFAEANSEASPQALRDGWQAIGTARERMTEPSAEFAEMSRRYFTQKAGWNLADYTDLLEFWLEQINNELFTTPWSHVLVDEIQDLSPLQLTLVRSLLPASGEGFFGIGDPDQSIYGFRGAHGQSHAFFSEAWGGLEVIALTHNYRSRPGILAAATSSLDGHGVSGALIPQRTDKAALFLFEAQGADSEAVWVAQRVSALIGRGSHTLVDADRPELKQDYSIAGGDYTPGDIAILVRTHALAQTLRKALARTGVPVSDPAGDAFWADPRVALLIKEAGRMLGIAVAQDENSPNIPVFPDKILTKGPLGLAAYLSDIPPFDALFWQSSAFRSLVKAFDTSGGWAELITWISLQNELELVRAKAEKVQILSLHAAKGLEFSVVFMPCLEDGLMPFAGPELLTGKLEKGFGVDIDEERRLFYVGLTRAKDALFLSFANRRLLYGRELRLKPSRFIDTLPAKGEGALARTMLVAHSERTEKQLSLI